MSFWKLQTRDNWRAAPWTILLPCISVEAYYRALSMCNKGKQFFIWALERIYTSELRNCRWKKINWCLLQCFSCHLVAWYCKGGDIGCSLCPTELKRKWKICVLKHSSWASLSTYLATDNGPLLRNHVVNLASVSNSMHCKCFCKKGERTGVMCTRMYK
jgi:hypothetical protein